MPKSYIVLEISYFWVTSHVSIYRRPVYNTPKKSKASIRSKERGIQDWIKKFGLHRKKDIKALIECLQEQLDQFKKKI